MGRGVVGEFEQLVLLAVLRRDGEAYAVTIVEEIRARTRRDASLASIYVVLGRLESKGFLTSEVEGAESNRGGRPRRYYSATPLAIDALRASREALLSLWDGLAVLTE